MKILFKELQFQLFIVFFLGVILISLTTEVDNNYGVIKNGKWLIILTTILTSTFYAYFLSKFDTKRIITSHTSRVLFRFVLLTFIPIILWNNRGDSHRNEYILIAFLAYTSFFLEFDRGYNIAKGRNEYTLGSTALLDKFVSATVIFKKYPESYFIFKICLFLFSLYLCIEYY